LILVPLKYFLVPLKNILWGLKSNVGIFKGTIYLFNPSLYLVLNCKFSFVYSYNLINTYINYIWPYISRSVYRHSLRFLHSSFQQKKNHLLFSDSFDSSFFIPQTSFNKQNAIINQHILQSQLDSKICQKRFGFVL